MGGKGRNPGVFAGLKEVVSSGGKDGTEKEIP